MFVKNEQLKLYEILDTKLHTNEKMLLKIAIVFTIIKNTCKFGIEEALKQF